VLKGHEGRVYAVAFSADGKTLATSSKDATIRNWDVESTTQRAILGHGGKGRLGHAPERRRNQEAA